MNEIASLKIDIFCHILPKRYKEILFRKSRPCYYLQADTERPALFDLEERFRFMDKFEGLQQVLTIGAPPLEYAVSGKDAVDLSKIANDEMAELLNKYPDRFIAAVACLPMNDINAALA
ncbi:MAG: amidohydrolase, partial [Deltaproteobacteria bacterium]|nr:amidohydrolase [Deltaproteobacteria bacterium]